MKTPFKRIAIVMAFGISIACADYYYNVHRSLFYPEIADRPEETQPYYYTPNLYFSYDAFDAGYSTVRNITDSLNIEAWFASLNKKVKKEIIKAGLYENSTAFDKSLRSLKMDDAVQYIQVIRRIDTLDVQIVNSWDNTDDKPADIPKLMQCVAELSAISAKTSRKWLKDRCLYAQMKALRFAGKNKDAIQLYEKNAKSQSPGLIADMTSSQYAGAFYHDRNISRSFYEFSKLLSSPYIGHEAPFNVRVYDMPFDGKVLALCKTDREKADAHTIAALMPKQDLPAHIRSVHKLVPDHPYLHLLVSRMINKYEDFYNAKTDKDRFYWSPEDSIAYQLPTGALDSVMNVTFDITKSKNIQKEPFYAYAMSYLIYAKGDISMAKLWTSLASVNNDHERRQKYVQEVLNYLAAPDDKSKEREMIETVDKLSTMSYGRDAHVMQTISDLLVKYYSNDKVKSFYAGGLKAIAFEGDWETGKSSFKYGGFEQQEYLDSMATERLSPIVQHFEQGKPKGVDSILMKIASISKDELYTAYGRRLILDGKWSDAKTVFGKVDRSYVNNVLKGISLISTWKGDEGYQSYTTPRLWIRSVKRTPIKTPTSYLDQMVAIQIKTQKSPNDSQAWYDYAMHQLNTTYWGSAWIYAKSKRSSAELPKAGLPKSDIDTYYGCRHVVASLDKATQYVGSNHALNAQITYLRALVENYQAIVAVDKLYPENYWELNEDDEKKLNLKVEQLIKDKYSIYTRHFLDKVQDSEYKRMIIEECSDIRKVYEGK